VFHDKFHKENLMSDNEHKTSRRSSNLSRRSFLGAALTAVPAVGLFGKNAVIGQTAPVAVSGQAKIKEYRTLGRTGFKVSDVSFGAGPLNNANVLAAALDRGMNYIDTAEHYERGNSERTIGEVLQGRDRKSVFICSKLNLTFNKQTTKEGLRDRFMKCLERLKTDQVECLMIHMCTLAQVKYEPYHELIRELKAEGKVQFSGLSNHGADNSLSGRLDEPMEDVVLAAAEDGRFDVILGVYNILKDDVGAKIFPALKSKNMGLTLMKMNPALTTAGDRETLTAMRERYKKQNQELPEAIQRLAKGTEDRGAQTDAFLKKYNLEGPEQARDAAIKYCLNRPEVHCVCPSINTFEDLNAYLALSGARFEAREAQMLADYRETYGDQICRIGCTTCASACPKGVPVNSIMRYEYYFQTQRREKSAMAEYAALGQRNAELCEDCPGYCEQACPHGVPIQGKIALAHVRLTPA
jgi:aryl-alcohol dehydrogenase-like predicted oxidoreductase